MLEFSFVPIDIERLVKTEIGTHNFILKERTV